MVTLLLLGLLAIGPGAAAPTGRAPLPHVRPLDPVAADLLSSGSRGSSTFLSLVSGLDRSSTLVVYVATTPPPGGRGSIVFVGRAAGVTYLLIHVSLAQTALDRIAVLAHELTHANEVANARVPIASDADLAGLYADIGTDSTGRHLESRLAVRLERAVHREIER